jgi:PAS domain S-box-containing protein
VIQDTPEGNQTLYQLMPIEITLQLAALAIFAVHYWNKLPLNYVSGFIGGVGAVNIIRFLIVFYLRYFGDSRAEGHGIAVSGLILISNFFAGLCWGGGLVLLSLYTQNFSLQDAVVPVLVAVVVVANLAGSALWSWLFLAFAVPALVLPFGYLLYAGDYYPALTWALLTAASMLIYWGNLRAEGVFSRYRQLGKHNTGLIQELAVAKEQAVSSATALEAAHKKLTEEFKERKVIEEKIRASEKETARILQDMQDTYFRVSGKGLLQRLSPSIQLLLGYSCESLQGKRFAGLFVNPKDYQALLSELNDHCGVIQNYEAELSHTLGHSIWASFNVHFSSNTLDASQGFEGTIRDITQNKKAEEALYREKERLHVTLESIGDGVITTDTQGKVIYLNPIAEFMTGWEVKQACEKQLNQVLKITGQTNRQVVVLPIKTWLKDGKRIQLSDPMVLQNIRNQKEYTIELSVSPLRDVKGAVIGSVLVFHNVTKLRTLAKQLSYQATHDSLTGLINRREFETRVEQAIASARDENKHHVLLYIDLDQFKIVNDTCGHHAGDELLKQITNRIKALLRESDTLARLGGG